MSERAVILVVEDSAPTRAFLADNLTADGYEVLPAAELAAALRTLELHPVDLAVVDIGLPDGSGLELLRRVREGGGPGSRIDARLPLLVVSGRTGETDRVRGFERGADDFVPKPFSYGELRLRIAALLRRARERRVDGRLRVGELALDPVAREVRVRGARVDLSAKEFALLRRLAAEPTRVFTKAELLRDVWGFRALGATRTLDSHACRLRRKLAVGRRPLRDQRVGRRLPADRRRGRRGGGRRDRRRDGGAGVTAALAVAGWAAALAAAGGVAVLRVSMARRRALVAQAAHELRGPLGAALLGLHGVVADAAGRRRVAAVELELRRAGPGARRPRRRAARAARARPDRGRRRRRAARGGGRRVAAARAWRSPPS